MAVLANAAASRPTVAARLREARDRSIAPVYLRRHLPEPDYARPPLGAPGGAAARILANFSVLYGREKAETWWPEFERMMRIYHAHKTPRPLRSRRVSRRHGADHLRRPPGHWHPGRPSGLRPGVFMRGPSTPSTSSPSSPTPPTTGSRHRLRAGGPASQVGGHRGARPAPASCSTGSSTTFSWRPAVIPQGFLNGDPEFQDFFIAFNTPGRHRPRPPAPHPRPARLGPPVPLRHHQRRRRTCGRPSAGEAGRPRLPQPPGPWWPSWRCCSSTSPGAGASFASTPSPTSGVSWELLPLRPPRRDPRPGQLFRSKKWWRGGDRRPQRPPRGQRRLLRRRDRRGAGDLQLALPPLVLHTFHTTDTAAWARTLDRVSDTATYFNFLDSAPDGIGLMVRGDPRPRGDRRPRRPLLPPRGCVSFRDTGDENQEPLRDEHHVVQRPQSREEPTRSPCPPGRSLHRRACPIA